MKIGEHSTGQHLYTSRFCSRSSAQLSTCPPSIAVNRWVMYPSSSYRHWMHSTLRTHNAVIYEPHLILSMSRTAFLAMCSHTFYLTRPCKAQVVLANPASQMHNDELCAPGSGVTKHCVSCLRAHFTWSVTVLLSKHLFNQRPKGPTTSAGHLQAF